MLYKKKKVRSLANLGNKHQGFGFQRCMKGLRDFEHHFDVTVHSINLKTGLMGK